MSSLEYGKKESNTSNQTLLNHFVEFPSWTEQFRIIPLVKVTDRKALWYFWEDVRYDIIAVDYLALRKNRRLHTAALSQGIKKALGFNGTCLSVLVGDNWLLDHTPVKQYFDDVTAMGFDAATTHDDYVYWDDPVDHRFHRIHKTLDRARELTRLNPRFDVIGIVKGSTRNEIEFCVDRLADMNIRMIAFPCSELAFERRLKDVREFLRYGDELKLWRLLIGIGSPQNMWRFDADCFSSSKWCYSATWGYEFSMHGVKRSARFQRCRHSLCRSLIERRVPNDVRLARHNILSLVEMNESLVRRGRNGNW